MVQGALEAMLKAAWQLPSAVPVQPQLASQVSFVVAGSLSLQGVPGRFGPPGIPRQSGCPPPPQLKFTYTSAESNTLLKATKSYSVWITPWQGVEVMMVSGFCAVYTLAQK